MGRASAALLEEFQQLFTAHGEAHGSDTSHDHVTAQRIPSSFYVDCTVGNMGAPEGMDPPLHNPSKGMMDTIMLHKPMKRARSHTNECLRLRNALRNMSLVNRESFCIGEKSFVHFTNGNNLWLKCCVRGDDGKETAKCEVIGPKPPPEPPLPPEPPGPPPKTFKEKFVVILKKVKKIYDAVMAFLNKGCGMERCEAFGSYPAPICLKGATMSYYCVRWGLPGELHPQSPIEGQQDYRVFQLRSPAPAALALAGALAAPSQSEKEQTHGELRQRTSLARIEDNRAFLAPVPVALAAVASPKRSTARECGADFL